MRIMIKRLYLSQRKLVIKIISD